MKPIKSHTFRGKRWRIRLKSMSDADGSCESPSKRGKTIHLSPELDGLHLLNVVIHEAIHASVWDFDEEAVEETATDIARLLWRLGYRRMEEVE